MKRIRDDIQSSNFDERLSELGAKTHTLEAERLELDKEINTLSLQADTRARLDLKRDAVRTKTSEIQNTLVISLLSCN